MPERRTAFAPDAEEEGANLCGSTYSTERFSDRLGRLILELTVTADEPAAAASTPPVLGTIEAKEEGR